MHFGFGFDDFHVVDEGDHTSDTVCLLVRFCVCGDSIFEVSGHTDVDSVTVCVEHTVASWGVGEIFEGILDDGDSIFEGWFGVFAGSI